MVLRFVFSGAPPSLRTFHFPPAGPWRQKTDIIKTLVSIFGTKDVFVEEYRTILAAKLLACENYSPGLASGGRCRCLPRSYEPSCPINRGLPDRLRRTNAHTTHAQ